MAKRKLMEENFLRGMTERCVSPCAGISAATS